MHRISLATVAAALACCVTPLDAQVVSSGDPARVITASARARLDSTLNAFVASGKVAGVSALVFEKGAEAYFGAFGMADRNAGHRMTRDAIVQIYSMTKPITGVAFMTLYEQGKFKLDDPLSKYAPEFANMMVYAGTDANGKPKLEKPHRPITIRDITRHTAGFATGGDNPGVGRRGTCLVAQSQRGRRRRNGRGDVRYRQCLSGSDSREVFTPAHATRGT